MSEEIFLNQSSNKMKNNYMGDIKYRMGNAFIHISMGLLELFISVCALIEKASINYLSRTRPDVASMMRKGAPFYEIAKQYVEKK